MTNEKETNIFNTPTPEPIVTKVIPYKTFDIRYVEDVLNTNKAVGGENLLNLLKNYCRIEDSKKSIVVGIVGFPNVGKSSIINSLRRGKVVGVSSTPGYTKNLQEIANSGKKQLKITPKIIAIIT